MNVMTNRGRAYSYIRFSRPEQMDGDSLRRQDNPVPAFCERHGLDLADLTFRDLGVSAAAGANFETGALGQFFEAVKSGRVERGSYLIVEKMDRLSRDTVRAARDRFEALLDAGINIATLNPERIYRPESYDLTDMILVLVEMTGARQFSEHLSYRVGEAWANKRERAVKEGHKLTARCPAWLLKRGDSFEVIDERAAIVRQIFDWALRGVGKASIARRLNEEGIEPFGDGEGQARKADGWRASYITKILRNPAVVGTFQPKKRARKFEKARITAGEPIADYFPAVVEDSVYYAVKQMKSAPSGKRNRKGKSPLRNVLSGIAFCAGCKGKMHYVSKGKPPRGGQYLACDNARRKGTCEAKSIRYGLVIDQVIDAVKSFRVIEPDDSAAKARQREIAALAGKIAEKQATIDRYIAAFDAGHESASALEHVKHLESERDALKVKHQDLREKSIARESRADWREVAKLAYALSTMSRGETANEESTVHVAAELRRMIDRIEVAKGEPVKVIPNPDAYEAVPQSEPPRLIARKRKPLERAGSRNP